MRAILACVVFVLGCSSEAPFLSSDVSTHDMSLNLHADGDGDRTHVRVSLSGPRSTVRLTGSDRLALRDGAQEITMRPAGDDYEADLAPGAVDLGVRLDRVAPETSVDVAIPMPPATAITTVATASRAAPLAISWTPDGGPQSTTLSLSGACIPAISRPLSIDVGQYEIQPADLPGTSAETCDVMVTLTRALTQQSSAPPLEHRYLMLTQVATTVFESTP